MKKFPMTLKYTLAFMMFVIIIFGATAIFAVALEKEMVRQSLEYNRIITQYERY